MSDTAPGSRVGSQFGRYHLKRLLGSGGMGEVYEAEDTVKERVIALKLLSPALCEDPVFRERLQREARTAGRLQEPHVVPVHDYGEIDGQLYLDMRLISGTDLSTMLKESGALPPPRAVAIVRQAASALDGAHAAGVIHRDIKPENILITRDDFAYLVDFGIASAATDEELTQAGKVMGTWKYAAPERFTKEEITHRVDVYALACVLHECLTGSPPYRADSAGMLITAHVMDPIPRPSQLRAGIPAAFDAVIALGMAKDPKDRFASAGALALAANEALSAPDQHRASDIVEHSQQTTAPVTDFTPPAIHIASFPPTGPPLPPPTRPTHLHLSGAESAPRPAPPSTVATNQGRGRASGPSHLPANRPRTARTSPPGGGSDWPGQFGVPRRPVPRPPAARQRTSWLVWAAGATVGVVVLAGLAFWLLHPSQSTPAASSTTTTTASIPAASIPPAAQTQARLLGLLPPGYPPGACAPTNQPEDALAQVSCGQNVDPDGPSSGTYALFPNVVAVRAAFDRIVNGFAAVECPGRIQSPGAWHRTATPDQNSGILLCATSQGNPTVIWTNDATLLVSIVHGVPPGPTLDQLYAWWSYHS